MPCLHGSQVCQKSAIKTLYLLLKLHRAELCGQPLEAVRRRFSVQQAASCRHWDCIAQQELSCTILAHFERIWAPVLSLALQHRELGVTQPQQGVPWRPVQAAAALPAGRGFEQAPHHLSQVKQQLLTLHSHCAGWGLSSHM